MLNESNLSKFEAVLSNSASDWKEREEILKTLINGLSNQEAPYFYFVQNNSKGLALQLCDLRSGIGNLTSQVILGFVNNSPSFYGIIDYEKFSEQLLNRENVVKGLGSANKVIAGHAYNALCSLFSFFLVSFSSLESFVSRNKDNKIAKV